MGKAGNHYAAYAYPPAGAPSAYPPYGGGYASLPAPPGYPARPLPPPAGAAHRKPDNGKPALPVAYIALRYLLVYPTFPVHIFFKHFFSLLQAKIPCRAGISHEIVCFNLWPHIVLHVAPCKGIALVGTRYVPTRHSVVGII